CAACGSLKRIVRGVHGMCGTVVDYNAKAGDRKSDQAAFRYHGFEALLDRTNEFFGDRAAVDLVDKFKVPLLHGFHVSGNASVLSGTAGLFFVCVIEFSLA